MKKISRRNFMAAAAVAGLSVALAGCGGAGSSAGTETAASGSSAAAPAVDAAAAETMQIELTTAPVGLHPLKTNDSASNYVIKQIFETLYNRTLDGTSYVPSLAADMPVFSEDGKTATIALREGVTFQDGTPFTSADVAYIIDCLKDSSYGSQRPSIVGTVESYECPDDHTIVLHLAYNDGVLIAKLAHTNGAIVNSKLEKAGQDFLIDATGAGTGAYQYVSSVEGSSYDLAANPGYWGGEPEVKNIHYSVVSDNATAIARLQTGEADFLPIVDADTFVVLQELAGYTAANEQGSSIYYLSLRSDATAKNDLMANPDFRKMILECYDYTTYVDSMLNGLASYTKSIVGPTLVGYTPEMENYGVTYDLEDAKALCEANGWAGQTVTMLISTREWHENIAVYMQSCLLSLGINLEIIAEEWATFLADAKTDDYYDFCILSWSNVTGDGQQMLEPNFSTANGTRTKYNNAEFDGYVDASAQTNVLEERQQYMLEAVKKIQGDYIVAPLYSANQLYCYNSTKYSNLAEDKGGMFEVKDVTINR